MKAIKIFVQSVVIISFLVYEYYIMTTTPVLMNCPSKFITILVPYMLILDSIAIVLIIRFDKWFDSKLK